MASLHGLVRGENMELGRDSDTGGQVVIHHNILPYIDVIMIMCYFPHLILFHALMEK